MIKQLLLISGAILICVLIYTAPRTKQDSSVDQLEKIEVPTGIESVIMNAQAALIESDKEKLQELDSRLKSSDPRQQLIALDSITTFWDKRRVDIAAYYASQIADRDPSEKKYIDAAIRYFDAFRYAEDSLKKSQMVSSAIAYYEKALELNPSNLNVRTDLGVCYAEGTGAPMKGIQMLLGVVKEDPDHENAQMNLGFLSVKSGQYDKAIERFNTVLKINPLKSEVYLFKAQTEMRMGNTDEALISFEKFTEISNDQEMVREVKKYIKQIKNS
ncbi:MAG: tetratricopeptide repeat protein [Bacteroidia bacterium]|nr:tetratricopeptide repeat protein [Bacteroidia bacterium]